MKKPKGIDPTEAREKVKSDQATLVGAYEDDEECGRVLLDGSISMLDKRSKEEVLVSCCA